MSSGSPHLTIEARLRSAERIGWAFLRALLPFALTVLAIRLVIDPASMTLNTGVVSVVAAALGSIAEVAARRRTNIRDL